MKAILLQVRDGMCEDGTLCNAMMNVYWSLVLEV